MSDLKDMPYVTVEQVMRLRNEALSIESQLEAEREKAKELVFRAYEEGYCDRVGEPFLNLKECWYESTAKEELDRIQGGEG